MTLKRRFSAPEITTQMKVCPIPFRFDPYCGCAHGCKYCFGRNLVEFSRRNCDQNKFSYIEGNNPESFRRWFEKRINAEEYDYAHAESVAIKERIPLKIGTTSDPFPPMEPEERITYDILKILHEYYYPVQILTKNPGILADYISDFDNPNWSIACSLISMDEKMIRGIEPGAPLPKERLASIRKITDMGYHAMVKVQPAILPRIIDDLPDLIKNVSDSGAWAFNTEGLKVRITMKKEERDLFQEMTPFVGYDVRSFYKQHFRRTDSDYEPQTNERMRYIELAVELAKQYNLKYFVADNGCGRIGDGPECCGTQCLHDYKIWGECDRAKFFDPVDYVSKELGKSTYRIHFAKAGIDRRTKLYDHVKTEKTLFEFTK